MEGKEVQRITGIQSIDVCGMSQKVSPIDRTTSTDYQMAQAGLSITYGFYSTTH